MEHKYGNEFKIRTVRISIYSNIPIDSPLQRRICNLQTEFKHISPAPAKNSFFSPL